MTVRAVEGVAGSGKTHRLLEMLVETLDARNLEPHQRVLALTFMHGARKRLSDRLNATGRVSRRFESVTIDSLALRLRQRWRGLSVSLGLLDFDELDFDSQCDLAGRLLERTEVRAWVAATYPIVLVDEAQDLRPQRLRIIRALSNATTTLLAMDEFQCLDRSLRPNPVQNWVRTVCQSEVLQDVRRTRSTTLLSAGVALRSMTPPRSRGDFKLFAVRAPQIAAAYLANAIRWNQGGTFALLTPSLRGGFAKDIVSRVCAGPCGRQRAGPYPLRWETSEQADLEELVRGIALNTNSTGEDAIRALQALPPRAAVRQTIGWVRRQQNAHGRNLFTRQEILNVVKRHLEQQRHFSGREEYRLLAMTIQQAKNREFDGVAVIWPYQVGGDGESKYRLLYNAITRARYRCTVLVQGSVIPEVPPFGAAIGNSPG